MSPVNKEKLSRGVAIHRRRILAETRQNAVFDVNTKILERRQAEERLVEIDFLLKPDNQTLSMMNELERDQTRIGLEIERIWIQVKLGIITPGEKQQALASTFDELEKTKPHLYQWLTFKNEHGLSMAEKIRNKVFPPTRVAGYYTKR